MGRQKEHQQLLKQHTDSIAAKTALHGLIQLVKSHCEISLPEADLLGRMLYHYYKDGSTERNEGQIIYPAKWKPGHSGRNSKPLEEPIMVHLTITHPNDVELWREQGVYALQQARIVRITEEAHLQGGILSLADIGVLTNMSGRAVRETLKPLWEQGVFLPVMGMAKKYSDLMKQSLHQTALSRYLAEDPLNAILEELHLSSSAWELIKAQAEQEILRQQGDLFEVWLQSPSNARKESLHIEKQGHRSTVPRDRDSLYDELTTFFGMSKAGATLLLEKVEEWLGIGPNRDRSNNQLVYFAVADYEPAGKALHECALTPVVLDYMTGEDEEVYDIDKPKPLFGQRLRRIARQAYEQGGVLNHSDLAFILNVGQDAIKAFMKNSEKFVPTRGNVVDIGPGLTHAKKIIRLFMEGYTESEIVRRTHHSYASVENYVDRFCKIVGLKDDGLTAVEIRIALGCSLNTVKDYLELAQEFDTKEYRWTMGKIRSMYAQKKTTATRKRR